MSTFIEARVIQKVDTEANWMANPLKLYQGEVAYVSDKNNFKLNQTTTPKTFAELEYYYKGDIIGGVLPTDDLANKPDGVYRATISGTYSGVVVKEGYYTLLRKDNGIWSLESEVKMPMQNLDAINSDITALKNKNGGQVTINETKNVDGGQVFNFVNNSSINKWNLPNFPDGYYKDILVVVDDAIWKSLANNNTDKPSSASTKWKEVKLGAEISQDFVETNTTAVASMSSTARYITSRFGVDIGIIEDHVDAVTLTQSNAGNYNEYLKIDNKIYIDNTAKNSYVIHNYDISLFDRIKVSGYILKDSQYGRTALLGIKANGVIVDLTAGYNNYQLLDNEVFDVSEFTKLSINMAGGFSVVLNKLEKPFPKIADFFMEKTGFSEIHERISDRYISTYKGVTVLQLHWEVTEYIRVEVGDELEVSTHGWASGCPLYAFFDTDKNWVESGDFAPTNGALVEFKYKVKQDGYITVGNYKLNGEMKVYLNKSSKNKIEELNNKLIFDKPKEIDYSTPTSLETARYFEPYLDNNVLKVKTPTTVRDKIVLNDEPKIVENRFVGEHSFVYFKGRILVYYSEAVKIGPDIYDVLGTLSVGEIDEISQKHSYLQRVIYGGVSDVPVGYNVHRTHAFVENNFVYVFATVEKDSVSEIWLFKSSDGFNFSKVKTISNSGFGFNRYGNLWLVTEKIDGYYYFFYEGNTTSGVWSVKIARSTSIEGDYTFYQNVTGCGHGGAVGGICVIYHKDKFRMWYHYSPNSTNLPTYLGYAESLKANIGNFTVINQPFLGLENSPIGAGTDQNGDFALLEINGSMWVGYQYAINRPLLTGVFCYKKLNGLTYDKLFN